MSILVLLKPDIVGHQMLAKVAFKSLKESGLTIEASKRIRMTESLARQLYAQHEGKFFYNRLVRHLSSGEVIALKVCGNARACIGSSKTWPREETHRLSLRQRLALSDVRNVAHASDAEDANRELQLFDEFFQQTEQANF